MFAFVLISIISFITFFLFFYLVYCIICIHHDTKTIADFCVWYFKNKKD